MQIVPLKRVFRFVTKKKKKKVNISPASVRGCWASDSSHSELEVSVWTVLLWPVATNNKCQNTLNAHNETAKNQACLNR